MTHSAPVSSFEAAMSSQMQWAAVRAVLQPMRVAVQLDWVLTKRPTEG